MMPRFFALNGIARPMAMMLFVLTAVPLSHAGSDKDLVTPIYPPGGGGGGGGGGGWRGGGGRLDDSEIDRAAIIGECGWAGRLPRGNPFERGGSLSVAWQEGYLDVSRFQWSRSYASSDYRNALCEMFLLQSLRRDANGLAKFRDRCEAVRSQILDEAEGSESGGQDVGNFSALDAFLVLLPEAAAGTAVRLAMTLMS